MACLTALTLAEAKALALDYGLVLRSVEALEAGSVNSNFRFICEEGPVFARIYEEQGAAGAEAELRLLQELSTCGVPVTAPVRRLDGAVVGTVGAKPFSVYPWVSGEWLCHQRLTPTHCRLLGDTLARVHNASSALGAIPKGRFGLPQLRERLGFIAANAPEYGSAVEFIEAGLARYQRDANSALPRGLIHGDLFRDNVLWRLECSSGAPVIAALIDFESASEGAFVYDLMVCILSWCFTDALNLDRVHAMLDGYESVRPLNEAEREATTTEGMAVCLRFATTRITDFAMRTPPGTAPKRDFNRFLQRYAILQGGVMRQVWGERS